jgi:capsular polysaccharide export protein
LAAVPDQRPLPPAAAPTGVPGPFRPAPLGGRAVPVALVVGASADPLGEALARPAPPADSAILARLAEGRIGAPPGLADPGAAGLGLPLRAAALVLDPCDPSRHAEAQACLAAARRSGLPVRIAPDPFAPGSPTLPPDLPRLDPWTLFEIAAVLHGASRDLALLALAAGVPLADGPFAGADRHEVWGRLLAATHCTDPFTGTPCSLAAALDLLGLWKVRAAEGQGIAACLGIHRYKRPDILALLGRDDPPGFHDAAGPALAEARARGGALLAWAGAAPPDLRALAAAAGVRLVWLEDGFIRSAGLGAALHAGASFALDGRGPHFDPAQPSDLEHLLETVEIPSPALARAAALRAAIVARGITKYNLRGPAPPIAAPPGRRRILVPGQVEDDASVRLGGAGIATNLELLRRVRAAEPEAWLVYKPHPDIEAGFRQGRIPARTLRGLADQVINGAPMQAVLPQVDAVHTLTSLSGFEALLRGLPVTCWGQPFYAGWGLTEDRAPIPRRSRRRSLDELVAIALILYPRCLDPVTGLPCPPETLIDRLARPELFAPRDPWRLRWQQGQWRRLFAWLRGLR